MDLEMAQQSSRSTVNLTANRDKKTWWSERSTGEKTLSIVCACLSIGLVISLAAWAKEFGETDTIVFRKVNSQAAVSSNVCLTETCIQNAARILSRFNNKTEP
jgi:hypothetical protein